MYELNADELRLLFTALQHGQRHCLAANEAAYKRMAYKLLRIAEGGDIDLGDAVAVGEPEL